jgi:fibrillarin-like rRNA methylase
LFKWGSEERKTSGIYSSRENIISLLEDINVKGQFKCVSEERKTSRLYRSRENITPLLEENNVKERSYIFSGSVEPAGCSVF